MSDDAAAKLKAAVAERNRQRQQTLLEAKAGAPATKEPFDADRFKEIYERLNPYDKYTPWETLLAEAEYDYYVSYPDKMSLTALVEHLNWLDGFS